MTAPPAPSARILVTNDDGIDSAGLIHLAQAMTEHGDVTVVAPDREFSGAGAAIGALWEFEPIISRREIDGVSAAWTVNGPPALCVMYARMGLFGPVNFDLVVSGINPGANVGRSVYHSGTIGACLTARNSGISGVAVSQMFPDSYEGQAIADLVNDQVWETAAQVASEFVGVALANGLPTEPFVANLNVPNVPLDQVKGVRRTEIGVMPTSTMTTGTLIPNGDDDTFSVDLSWGSTNDENANGTDSREVADGYVTLSYLSRIEDIKRSDIGGIEERFGAALS